MLRVTKMIRNLTYDKSKVEGSLHENGNPPSAKNRAPRVLHSGKRAFPQCHGQALTDENWYLTAEVDEAMLKTLFPECHPLALGKASLFPKCLILALEEVSLFPECFP
jgi:hypothetical protein